MHDGKLKNLLAAINDIKACFCMLMSVSQIVQNNLLLKKIPILTNPRVNFFGYVSTVDSFFQP